MGKEGNKKRGIARMLREADEQGGTLADTDLSLILSCSNMAIHKNITVPTPSTDILAISTVCVSALRKDCRWKRPHSQRS